MRIAWAFAALIESTTSWYSAWNVATGVISVESPALVELRTEPSTSLLPIHTLTNVGCAAAIAWICVRPPSISCVSGLELVPGTNGPLCRMSITSAEGTATLVRDRKSTRLNSSHTVISYAVFCLKKKKKNRQVDQNTDMMTQSHHNSVNKRSVH